MKIQILLHFIICIIFYTACKGPEGPQGPPGPAGAPGAIGPPGQEGEKGDTGNANIKSYTFLNQSLSSSEDLILELAAITQEVIEQGFIFGYIRSNGTSVWYTLPYIEGNELITIFSISEENIRIASTVDADNVDIKIVVAEGISNTNMRLSNGEIDFNDFNQVKEFLNINE